MRTLVLAVVVMGTGSTLAAQSLARRIQSAPDGEVRLAFAGREGLCGDGETFIHDRSRDNYVMMRNWSGKRRYRDEPCDEGPVRVTLKVSGGAVRGARAAVGGDWRRAGSDVTDLGVVGAATAAKTLVELARTSRTGASDDLIFPATLADRDSVAIWTDLLSLARDRQAQRSSRKQAVFWVSQAAGEKAAEGLAEIAGDEDEDREIRDQAVFALSQLPEDEGIPILLRVARTNRDPEVRKKAMFWLGQSEDPRALALFEEILSKPE